LGPRADVLAGEGGVKAAGERYLPRLDSQSEEEYSAYKAGLFLRCDGADGGGILGPDFPPCTDGRRRERKDLQPFVRDCDMLVEDWIVVRCPVVPYP
jgi:hypothetical protein